MIRRFRASALAAALGAAAALSGCGPSHTQELRADQTACTARGLPPDTVAFSACVRRAQDAHSAFYRERLIEPPALPPPAGLY